MQVLLKWAANWMNNSPIAHNHCLVSLCGGSIFRTCGLFTWLAHDKPKNWPNLVEHLSLCPVSANILQKWWTKEIQYIFPFPGNPIFSEFLATFLNFLLLCKSSWQDLLPLCILPWEAASLNPVGGIQQNQSHCPKSTFEDCGYATF